MELIHADGCSTNLGFLGAECNCGAQAQLESDKKEHKKVVAEIFKEIEAMLFWDLDKASLKALKQKYEVE